MTNNYHQVNHPLMQHKLGKLRNKNTSSFEFRKLIKDISGMLAYEAMTTWDDFEQVPIETPIAKTTIARITNAPIIVSVMRAGNPMSDAILTMLPVASAGHIGIYKEKFINNTVEYYFKLPEKHVGKAVLLCEPLLATADTAIAAIDRLKEYEVGKITLLSILVSKEGLKKLLHFHPDVHIYALSDNEIINELGYLVPGLGDAGDRIYNTK